MLQSQKKQTKKNKPRILSGTEMTLSSCGQLNEFDHTESVGNEDNNVNHAEEKKTAKHKQLFIFLATITTDQKRIQNGKTE